MDILKCPNCLFELPYVETTDTSNLYDVIYYYTFCPSCGCKGPSADTYDEAIESWNEDELKCRISKVFKRER